MEATTFCFSVITFPIAWRESKLLLEDLRPELVKLEQKLEEIRVSL